jgi:hypothetical protein
VTTSPGLSINTRCTLQLNGFKGGNEYDVTLGVYLSKDDNLDNSDVYLGYSIEQVNDYDNTAYDKTTHKLSSYTVIKKFCFSDFRKQTIMICLKYQLKVILTKQSLPYRSII